MYCISKDAAMACLQVTIQALVTWEALAPMRIKWLYAHMQMSSFGYTYESFSSSCASRYAFWDFARPWAHNDLARIGAQNARPWTHMAQPSILCIHWRTFCASMEVVDCATMDAQNQTWLLCVYGRTTCVSIATQISVPRPLVQWSFRYFYAWIYWWCN